MKRNFFALALLLLVALGAYTPENRLIQKNHSASATNYQDFIIDSNKLWALTTEGQLKLFDLSDYRPTKIVPINDSPIVMVARDRYSNIVIADNVKYIKKYDKENHSWTIIGKYSGSLYGIVFDYSNACFLLTSNGIIDLRSKAVYFPDSSLNQQIHCNHNWFRKPVYFMDKENFLWIGFGYGEWGGDLVIFDTRSKRFVIPHLNGFEIDLNPVKAIFSDSSNVYLSTGLDHMATSGSIIKFQNFNATVLFDSSPYSPKNKETKDFIGEYIGPATFNEADHCIYFYSQHGIFKGNPQLDLSTIGQWEKVVQPHLKWSFGQPDAVGSPMNVLKMEFASNHTLVFLSQSNGIGIFNGKTITLLE